MLTDHTTPSLEHDVALARRVGRRLGLLDVDGRVSARTADGSAVVVTPGPAGGTPRRLAEEALLIVGLDGELRSGSPGHLPTGLDLDLAIFRRRPDVRAIAAGAPWTGLAFGSVGRDVLPLTHTWAEYAHEGTAWLDETVIDPDPATADAAANVIGRRGYVHLPGITLLALGDGPLDAVRRLDAFEYLARLTAMATALGPQPATVSREQVESIHRQRPPEAVSSRDYRRYYRSLDVDPGPSLSDTWPAGNDESRVQRDIAIACRLLAHAGDLVAFFEHVSHRIPGTDDRFAMSPAKDFASMVPEDIGIIATDGDCATILGPYPPAPFRWYHRDLLVARPDVKAIVHTHELAGRAFLLAGADAPPIHRLAVHGMRGQLPPVFPEASLVFSEDHRRRTLDLLGDGPWVHAFAHGTDFVAGDLPTATVRAISWDRHLRFTALARSLGDPRVLDGPTLDTLAQRGASAGACWVDLIDGLHG